jgi:hypothetical protein
MNKSALKHGPDPPTAGPLKPTLPSSLDHRIKRRIVKCPLNILEGTQRNLFMFKRIFQSMNNLEKSSFGRHTRPIGKLVPVKWFLSQNTTPDVSID